MAYDDLNYKNSSRARLLSRREQWERDRISAYDDCLSAVSKIKYDVFTQMARNKKVKGEIETVGDWMIAMAEDIEAEIAKRRIVAMSAKEGENE